MEKILAIDLDGTLFYPKGHKRLVNKKNTAFVKRFVEEGNKVVLISSRTPAFCEKVLKELDLNLDYISLTGSIIKVNGEIKQDLALSNENIKSILDDIKKEYKPIAYLLTCKDQPIILRVHVKVTKRFFKFYSLWYKLKFGIYREDYIPSIKTFNSQLESGRIYAVKCFFGLSKKMVAFNKNLNKVFHEKYPTIETSWMGICLEISPKGCSKGKALKAYLDLINRDDKENVYVIGDSGNDISMFREFDNSYVMKKASKSVKKYAKHEISRVYKLEKVLLERSKDE